MCIRDSLNVSSRNQGDSISLYLRSDDIFVGGVYMPDFSVQGGVKENQIRLATRFNNKENGAYALISTCLLYTSIDTVV